MFLDHWRRDAAVGALAPVQVGDLVHPSHRGERQHVCHGVSFGVKNDF